MLWYRHGGYVDFTGPFASSTLAPTDSVPDEISAKTVLLSGFASVAVALALFGLMTLYSSYQETGGLEGRIKQINTPGLEAR